MVYGAEDEHDNAAVAESVRRLRAAPRLDPETVAHIQTWLEQSAAGAGR